MSISASSDRKPQLSEAETWKYAEKTLTWYGWGSPIGVGIFFVCVAVTIALVRYAFLG